MFKRIIISATIAIAIAVPTVTSAAGAVSITKVSNVMGNQTISFSNGVTCVDNVGSPKLGAVTFYAGWFAYYYTQNGVQNSCN